MSEQSKSSFVEALALIGGLFSTAFIGGIVQAVFKPAVESETGLHGLYMIIGVGAVFLLTVELFNGLMSLIKYVGNSASNATFWYKMCMVLFIVSSIGLGWGAVYIVDSAWIGADDYRGYAWICVVISAVCSFRNSYLCFGLLILTMSSSKERPRSFS
jgi:hypothetical protein